MLTNSILIIGSVLLFEIEHLVMSNLYMCKVKTEF